MTIIVVFVIYDYAIIYYGVLYEITNCLFPSYRTILSDKNMIFIQTQNYTNSYIVYYLFNDY